MAENCETQHSRPDAHTMTHCRHTYTIFTWEFAFIPTLAQVHIHYFPILEHKLFFFTLSRNKHTATIAFRTQSREKIPQQNRLCNSID